MQQMYSCPRCGNSLYFNDRICGYCGLAMTWQSPQQPPYQYQQPQYQQPPHYPYQGYQQPPGWGPSPPPPPPPPPMWGTPQQPPYNNYQYYQQPQGFYGYGGAPRKSGSSGLTTLIVILAIILLVVGGIGVATNGKFDIMSLASLSKASSAKPAASAPAAPANGQPNSPSGPSAPTIPAVSADELITAYKTDQAAAATKYKTKTVTVSGKVAAYALSEYSVTLKGDTATDFAIKCMFSKGDTSSILSLNPDQLVKVTGTVGDLKTGDITITDCTFVK